MADVTSLIELAREYSTDAIQIVANSVLDSVEKQGFNDAIKKIREGFKGVKKTVKTKKIKSAVSYRTDEVCDLNIKLNVLCTNTCAHGTSYSIVIFRI